MNFRRRHWSLVLGPWSFVFVWSLLIGHWTFATAAEISKPLSPDEAQAALQLADPSLRIELAASEPNVIDPVAIRFDEDGRMWVAEMRDYPLGNPAGGDPLSRIKVLEDRDGDGRFETATIFADKLLFVTGLQPWKGGVFVTRSGALTYMKDTNGDGMADFDEIWFEGFAELNSQLRANHPRLGLDNWIYVANGLRGGKVVNRKLKNQEPINISGMDFRFDPLTGRAEAISGNGQFGLCFDDWGNRFTCSNRNPVRHVVIEDRYLKAKPGVTVAATVSDVAAFGEQSRIFPISRAWTTSNLHAGQFTAACGVYIYRGDLLPAEFKGNVFTCDPTGNLIHREIMQPAGPTFTSKPAYDSKEFLASADEWFRPVNMELGPDGALYVVDMYRCVIEHPDFVPDELKRRPDLRLGDDCGRIWRIVPGADTSPKRKRGIDAPPIAAASPENLVSLLEHPNAWQRDTAQRLLLEFGSSEMVSNLRQFAKQSKSPQGRARSLWTLAGLSAINRDDFVAALSDHDSGVRRQALLLLEPQTRLAGDIDAFSALLADDDPAVRFQARLTAGNQATAFTRSLDDRQLSLLATDADDPWMRRSIALGLTSSQSTELFQKWVSQRQGMVRSVSTGQIQLLEELSPVLMPDTAAKIGVSALNNPDSIEIGLAILRGATKSSRLSKPMAFLIPSAGRLLQIAEQSSLPLPSRTTAVSLLAFAPRPGETLPPFTTRNQEQAVRIAAIASLARQPSTEHWAELLDTFASDPPPVRRAIIDGMLTNSDRTKLLLDAIESARLKASEIDPLQAKRLIESRDASIKGRAGKLFAAATPAERAKALADYQPVLKMKGDAQHGQIVFEKNCSACHRIAGIGSNVAPDISDSRTKKLEQLLVDILQPNRAIDNNYLGYSVRQLDGTVLTGILTAETATSITLRQQGGKDAVIPRTEIDELRSSGQSLMPEGLERSIPPNDMADLLSFIKNWRYLDGRTPLSDSN
jgi:putative membrane-bound dehydrogenase-like protein